MSKIYYGLFDIDGSHGFEIHESDLSDDATDEQLVALFESAAQYALENNCKAEPVDRHRHLR